MLQKIAKGLSDLRHCMFRVKKPRRMDGQTAVSDLSQCLSTLDLTSLGIGSILGAGVYVVSGQVAKNIAGPAVILSFTIAAFASLLSGLCYAEFGSRVPKTTGSAYAYSYRTVGEFVAFIIGWNLILEYMIGTAADARALSGSIDFLTGNCIRDFTLAKIGRIPGLDSYPDFLGFLVTIFITVILAIGVKTSAMYTTVFNILNICLVVFIIALGLFHLNFANWTEPPGFFPYGPNGVLSGAAACFYAYVGFDIIATTGAEARTPSRSIPIAVVVSLVFCYLCYVGVSAVTSLVAPVTSLVSDSPLAEAFGVIGIHWAKYVVGVGAVFGLASSLLGSMFPLPRIIFAMAVDGLFFIQFTRVNDRTETPVLATVVPGVITAFFTAIFNLQELVEMMSIGTLLAYTLVCTSVLILRYQPDELSICEMKPTVQNRRQKPKKKAKQSVAEALKSDLISIKASVRKSKVELSGSAELLLGDAEPTKLLNGTTPPSSPSRVAADVHEQFIETDDSSLSDSDSEEVKNEFRDDSSDPDIDAIVKEYKDTIPTVNEYHGQTLGRAPSEKSGRHVCYATFFLCVLFLAFSLMVTMDIKLLNAKNPWIILAVILVVILIVLDAAFILWQPQDKIGLSRLTFKVPLVPWVPFIAIFINIYLMVRLSKVTWLRFIVWMVIGLCIYFFYGLRNSAEGKEEIVDEERVLLRHFHERQTVKDNSLDTQALLSQDSQEVLTP